MSFRCDREIHTLMRSLIRSFDICFLETNLFLTSDQQFQRYITVIIPLLTTLIHSGDITDNIYTVCRVPYACTVPYERRWVFVLLACNGPIQNYQRSLYMEGIQNNW